MIESIEKLLAMYETGAIDRRQLLGGLVAAALVTPAAAQPPESPFQGRVIHHVTLSVSDVARSREFYQKLLGATDIAAPPKSGPPKLADLRVGASFIGLYPLGNSGRIDHFSVGIDNYDSDKGDGAFAAALRRERTECRRTGRRRPKRSLFERPRRDQSPALRRQSEALTHVSPLVRGKLCVPRPEGI
jgi:catechol 2,3-dioxygenase-like lactoylglutathione lyase family enzyme